MLRLKNVDDTYTLRVTLPTERGKAAETFTAVVLEKTADEIRNYYDNAELRVFDLALETIVRMSDIVDENGNSLVWERDEAVAFLEKHPSIASAVGQAYGKRVMAIK